MAEHSVLLGIQNGAEADRASTLHLGRQRRVLEFLGMDLKINLCADIAVQVSLTIPFPYTALGV